jgi:hypothetical protein
MFSVLKVLQELPHCLVISVLAACPAELRQQLSTLAPSLHPLAIEAAFPSIRRYRSLTLTLAYMGASTTDCAVLHAATTATSALRKLHLKDICLRDHDDLLMLISAACRSALDVSLDFVHRYMQLVPQSQSFAHLCDTLSHNTALTSLQLTFEQDPCHFFNLASLVKSLTDLHSLKLALCSHVSCGTPGHLPPPEHIINLPCLTHLCLGPGFHFMELPQIVPHMTRLRALSLRGSDLQELPPLSPLTALQTLELQSLIKIEMLPPVATLTRLQTLDLSVCHMLQQLPPLATLTALLTLKLSNCDELQSLPPLDTLEALQTLDLTVG